jgi:hypothetical protein
LTFASRSFFSSSSTLSIRLPQRSFGSHGEAEGWVLADILWHTREGMTAHYSMAQVLEIRPALELITDERHANNVSLASIIAQRRAARIPSEVPAERKTA